MLLRYPHLKLNMDTSEKRLAANTFHISCLHMLF